METTPGTPTDRPVTPPPIASTGEAEPLTRELMTEEEVEALGERIAELSALISATEYQLLVLIREFDEGYGWRGGFASCAHWLNWRTGLAIGAAREKVRVARALAELPRISAAMRDGELSFSKVRALTRVATPETEERLLDFARAGTAAHVERLVRAWRAAERSQDMEAEAQRHADRHLHLTTDADGMVVVRGRLDPEVGAALMRAVEAAEEELFEKEGGEEGVAQRRADAIGSVAEAALEGGLDRGTRGDRYQVVVHVDGASSPGESADAPIVPSGEAEADEAKLRKEGRPPEPSEVTTATIEGVGNVSAETSRRIACDASRVVMTHDDTGKVLDVGRRTRAISPGLRRALEHRDGGCRFPGCGLRSCDAHHVEHWADGGETKLENLVLLCKRHHRAVHEDGYSVRIDERGSIVFRDPWNREMPNAPVLPALPVRPSSPEVATELLAALLNDHSVEVDPTSSLPEWDGRRFDLHWAVDALMN